LHVRCLFNKLLTLMRTFRLAHCGATICSTKSRRDYTLESTADEFCEAADTSLLPVIRVDAADLMRVLRQLEVMAKRQAPRIAFKAKGRILLLDLADIWAVQAEGNYVSLQHRPNPYLVHESLSSMAEKLKPYGFVRIHRSVVVNISAVEEIQPLPTGEYGLRVKGGKEYLVTRYIQTQPQRSGSTVGRLRAALRLTGSKRFVLAVHTFSLDESRFSRKRGRNSRYQRLSQCAERMLGDRQSLIFEIVG
jgi:LytTr DNA-binding domain